MFRFTPYIMKCLWRHRARTLFTVSGAAVAIFVFCVVGAVQGGLDDLAGRARSDRTLVVFQENRFCPASSRLPEDYARTIAKLPGVKDVVPIKVMTNNCRASLDLVVFNGMPAEKLRTARELTLISGARSDFESHTDAALAGEAVAARRHLKIGQRFTMGEVSVTIVGVFKSAAAAEENVIFTHLDFLQRAKGRNTAGTVTEFEVQLTDSADVDSVATAVDAAAHSGPVATTTKSKGVFQMETLSDLAELVRFARWLGYACLGLVLSLVVTTAVMAVQDRIQEHGILQTLGVRPMRVFRFVLAESLLQTIAGGALGVAASLALLAFAGLSIGTEGVSIAFRPSLAMAVGGIAVSAIIGLVAGVIPGYQAARTEIVAALRHA